MRQLHILIVIIFLTIMASSGCFIPEEPVHEVDLSKGPPKPPMDLDKPPPEEVSLIERMGYEDKDVIYAAYDELIAMGKDAVPILVEEGLKHENPGIRDASASTLGKIGPDAADAVPALIEALDDEYSQVQQTAIDAIGKIGVGADVAIPAIIEKLKIENWMLNQKVAKALTRLGDASVPFLIEVLETGDQNAKSWAMRSLREMGPVAKDAVESLCNLLRQDSINDPPYYIECGQALGEIGADFSVPSILAMLGDNNETILTRGNAASVIGENFPDSEEAFQALVGLLTHENFSLRGQALSAICKMELGPESVLPVLMGVLDDTVSIFRLQAVTCIGEFGVEAVEALPKLKEMEQDDPDRDVQVRASMVVIRIETALLIEETST